MLILSYVVPGMQLASEEKKTVFLPYAFKTQASPHVGIRDTEWSMWSSCYSLSGGKDNNSYRVNWMHSLQQTHVKKINNPPTFFETRRGYNEAK